ncbi:MAG: bifunctional precorrin-2 dehydrogenase/sirohydrochlorin ferrochelatase [Proteobacteria bacterium]|nr:bifunctional precorrin-2 dehydrogenase/sirohydrochlorin ferrochelatase [Pseudomonadota bacterium]MBU1388005.1 bifunctional precorrin-2 dehydrogenase/sirohydrochlorin ferrochelatase [Pseudomonadota bacterium]MBU1542068.1 bifunctional precorrin-2 dehydrogenase/sirohydrochlorin ferrochelatase [Pseudomonadota bacterium]MBU2430634.1 bifunctional precorrin-2 dehydrogenase/sirohydrochlorin ferrochelatase [Pseudomonadota bacterium]MBU2482852.1 bifunctional precorrin-2 dehydrogenase/sirohydrochlorin 
MKYYPVFMDMKGRDCLVVGGGPVGWRKASGLEKSGANVTVVSLQFSSEFDDISSRIVCCLKQYEKSDIQGKFFVFAATDKAALNRQIRQDAQAQNVLCNIADSPGDSDFVLPSTLEQGDLVIAVSTSGSSPAVARTVKHRLAQIFGPEYETFLMLMKNIRTKLLEEGHDPDGHKKMFYRFIEEDIPALIKAKDEKKINSVLNTVFGKQFNFQDLVSAKES